MTATTYVVVLGRGLAGRELEENSKKRVNAALYQVHALLECSLPFGGLVFAAGTGKDQSTETMASSYAWYASSCAAITHPHTSKVRFIVNEASHTIWGTVREMLWARDVILNECPDARIEFVTNSVHLRRVWLINKLITKIPNCGFVHSTDEPPKWYHEVLAYAKLLAYMMGLGEAAERFRRAHWSQ